MALGGNEKAPLLIDTDDDFAEGSLSSAYSKEAALTLPNDRVRGTSSLSAGKPSREPVNDSGFTAASATETVPSSQSVTGYAARQLLTQDHVVAAFVVAFDTHRGNIVEWCQPGDVDLEGVEFKAMASGAHTVVSDFIYFRKDHYYGLSCFENMHVDSAEERGARMKSVGILATTYTTLYRHMQFLESQVRHQLETPGSYTQLQTFYDDRKGSLPSSRELSAASSPNHGGAVLPSSPAEDLVPLMKITHPAGCFAQFLNFFGDQIFVLWKYVLLQKRIVFFSPPPIGVVCFRVYCACLLGAHDIPISSGTETKPFFYINIADIDMLESEVSYIACTTEKVFEEKQKLHDVYVDNQNVTVHTTNLKEMKKLNAMDKEKFNQLCIQRQKSQINAQEQGGSGEIDDDHVFATFFLEQNNCIFQTLLDASASEDRGLTNDHMKTMGLDPVGDRQFIMDIIELYGIDVLLMVDNPCCPV